MSGNEVTESHRIAYKAHVEFTKKMDVVASSTCNSVESLRNDLTNMVEISKSHVKTMDELILNAPPDMETATIHGVSLFGLKVQKTVSEKLENLDERVASMKRFDSFIKGISEFLDDNNDDED